MDFGDDFVENEVDPAAEFLAREQNELAGLEEDLTAPSAPMVNGNGLEDETPVQGVVEDVVVADPLEESGFEEVRDEEDLQPVRERREEPETIKKWREEQMKSLEEKDKMEEIKKEEWRSAAKKELDDWYKQHDDHLSKTRANNRNNQEEVVGDESKGKDTDWKSIAKLCDFNKKSTHCVKDASRMRSIILQLQQSPTKTKAV